MKTAEQKWDEIKASCKSMDLTNLDKIVKRGFAESRTEEEKIMRLTLVCQSLLKIKDYATI